VTGPFVRAAILNQGTNGIDQSRLQQVLEPPVNVLWNLGCHECVAHKSMRALSTAAPESAQIPVTAMVLGETMGHDQAQVLPPLDPQQALLFPPSPVEWLPENHLVFFLLDLAAERDLDAIHS
jgi:hypothetical protein